MIKQLWVLTCKIQGNFSLVKEEIINSTSRPINYVNKIILKPEMDSGNIQTGKFEIEIHYEIDTEITKLPSEIPADIGRNILSYYLDLLTFLSGHPVNLISQPSIKYNYPNSNKYRGLFFSSEVGQFHVPTPLLKTILFTIKIDPKIGRILSWFRKGLQEEDPVNSIISFFTSLEILSNQFECNSKITRKCGHCGYITELDPGMRQKIENFIISVINFTETQFEKIWDTRNKITHGGFDLTTENIRDLNSVKQDIEIAIIKGLKILLKIPSSEAPRELPPDSRIYDAILDVEYTFP